MKWARSPDDLESALAPTYRYGALALFAVAVLFIVVAPVFWNETQARAGAVSEAYENADLYHYFYPMYRYAFGRLRDGSLPLWNPRQLCGTPLLADARIGIAQPLNFPFLLLPTERAMALHAFVCLFLMGLFFTLLARAVGVGYFAAALGGMAYAFSGFSAAAMSRPPLAAAMVWTPLLLWAVREYAHRFDTASAVIAGITGALLILTGSYAIALVAGLVAALYAVQSLVVVERGSAEFSKRLRGLFVVLGIALGVSAVQWIPMLVYAMRLDNPLAWIWGPRLMSSAPGNIGEFFFQTMLSQSHTQPRLAYLGILPLIFAPVSILNRHRRRDATLYALIATGGVLAAAFFRWLPPLQFPVSALLLPFVIGIALLAAIGADRVFIPRCSFRSQSIWLPLSVALAVCAVMFVAFGADVRRYLIPIVPVLLVFALFRARVLVPVCYAALFAVLLIDATNASRTIFAHPRQDAPGCYETYAQALAAAHDQSLGGRVLLSSRDLDRGLSPNIAMLGSLRSVGGAGIPLTRDQAEWTTRLTGAGPQERPLAEFRVTPASPAPNLLRYMAARLLVAAPQGPMYEGTWEETGPRLRQVSSVGGVRLFVFDDALPRAFWVPRTHVEVGMASTMDTLLGDDFDPLQTCVVDAKSKGIDELGSRSSPESDAGATAPLNATCSIEELSPERVVLRVDAPRFGVTVLNDTFDPGWTATLDGARKPILKVNGMFRGIATPAGTHEIVFTYRPWSVYIGFGVSVSVLAIALISCLRNVSKRTPRSARALF